MAMSTKAWLKSRLAGRVRSSVTELPPWSTSAGESVKRYRLGNSGGMEVTVMSWGATITHIMLPGPAGGTDVGLGFDNMEGYLAKDNPYMGATVGRVANRISGAQFSLDGVTYNLEANEGENNIHGGCKGFDKVVVVTPSI